MVGWIGKATSFSDPTTVGAVATLLQAPIEKLSADCSSKFSEGFKKIEREAAQAGLRKKDSGMPPGFQTFIPEG